MKVYNEDEVFEQVRDAMVELFELDENLVTLDAHMYEELGLDSIDAIDLVVRLKNTTGIKVQPDDFKSVRTVEDVVKTVLVLLKGDNA